LAGESLARVGIEHHQLAPISKPGRVTEDGAGDPTRVGRLVRNSDGRQSRRRSKRLTATAVPGVKDLRWRPEASPSFTSGPFPWLCRLC